MIKERFNQLNKNLDRMNSQFDQSERHLDRMKGHSDQQDGKLEELMEMTRGTRQRLAPAATPCHRGRRQTRHQDSQAYEDATAVER